MDQREREFRAEWLRRLLEAQAGVVTWTQLRDGGLDADQIRRKVRRRELRRIHPRVYVDHTGPPTWEQRCWAAVLYAAPAALCGDTISERPNRDPSNPIHIAIDRSRRVSAQSGITIHRLTNLERRVFPSSPPRLRLEDNALLMAHHADSELDALGALTAVAGRRGVTAAALRRALDRFPRLKRRAWISAVLDDLEQGTSSVLEHGYLTRVARSHRLPPALRQSPRRTASGNEYRDLEYTDYGLVVELDGRLGHGTWEAGGRDADRDLDDLASGGMITARLRWHQVYGTPCRTADRLARVLNRAGWTGALSPCGAQCGAFVERYGQ